MSLRVVVPEMFSPGGPALNALMLQWCAERTRMTFQMGAVALGIVEGNDLLCVSAFDNLRTGKDKKPLSIECSIAIEDPRVATRRNIRAVLHYPFRQLKVQRVTTFIAASNERSIKFTTGLGFRIEGLLRHALDDDDLIVTGMVREEAERWLGRLD